MFNGRFASKSTSQLSLLNSTVSQLAKSVNMVLTMAYRDVYGEEDAAEEPTMLTLLTSPLAASDEVVNLFAAGLAPVEVAIPAALHAIGATKDEIEAAMDKAKKDEEKKCACDDEDRAMQTEEKRLSLQERKSALQSAPDKDKSETEQAQANVAQTKANTAKTLAEAKKGPEAGARAGGSSADEE